MTDHDKHAQYQFNRRLLRFNYDQRRRLKEAVSLLRSDSSAALQVQQAIIDLDASTIGARVYWLDIGRAIRRRSLTH